MHWADVIAERLAERGDSHIIATGITPSGPIHVGNMREVLTADLITRACEDRGLSAEMIYIADDADPLRKVYGFLDEAVYSEYIGQSLADIPAPDGEGSYADHFLEPFFATLEELGIEHRVVRASEAYRDGRYAEGAQACIEKRDEIRAILDSVRRDPLPESWFPYNPADHRGSQHGVRVTGFEGPIVNWVASDGTEGSSDVRKGEGKLPWRLDWAARWMWNGVTCEPFGKDHSAAGGSWDTGTRIVELLGGKAPLGVRYEWVMLKGRGAMSSSAGNTVSGRELLDLVPPEIMRFIISRNKPSKAFDFDPGAGLIATADEYERLETRYHAEIKALGLHTLDSEMDRKTAQKADLGRGFEFAQIDRRGRTQGDAGLNVSFGHLSLLCQVRASDEAVLESLGKDDARLRDRIRRMRNWIASDFFPEESRIVLRATSVDAEDRALLLGVREFISAVEWQASEIQNGLPDVAKALDLPVRDAFRVTYQSLLGKSRGPRVGTLLSAFDRRTVLDTLDSALD